VVPAKRGIEPTSDELPIVLDDRGVKMSEEGPARLGVDQIISLTPDDIRAFSPLKPNMIRLLYEIGRVRYSKSINELRLAARKILSSLFIFIFLFFTAIASMKERVYPILATSRYRRSKRSAAFFSIFSAS
jgi:hypothetical protein